MRFIIKHVLLLSITCIPILGSQVPPQKNSLPVLFADKPNGDYYWHALMLAANNKKEEAREVVATLKKDILPKTTYAWKQETPSNIDDFFDHLFYNQVLRDPQLLTYLGLFESLGIREHNAYLTPVNPATLLCAMETKEKSLQALKKYSCDQLTDEQKISYKIALWRLNHEVAGKRFLFHDYRLTQMTGVLADRSILLTTLHRLEDKQDFENYVARLQMIPQQLEQTIEMLSHQKKLGVVPPSCALKKVVGIIEKLTPLEVHENPFYVHLKQNAQKVALEKQEEILKHAHDIIKNQVHPSFNVLKDYCKELGNKAQINQGVWALPDGDAYYAHALQWHTSSGLSADEIHELGLQQVAQIQKEMRAIFIKEGFTDTTQSIGQLMEIISKDPQFYFPNTQEGSQKCIEHYHAILDRVRQKLYCLFDIKPKMALQIKPVPKHEQDAMPGAYYAPPSIDGSRPGIFFANLRNLQEVPKFWMETVTIHEAEPGHHFQIALQNEMNIPMMRKLSEYTAYVEGWALYAEKLAYEYDFYSSSFMALGHLRDELFRAVRLVVDTGIHKKRWSYEEAIAYMEKETGIPHKVVVTEVERYFVLPGQACAYKIGQLKILELRARAKEALKEKFDIKEFHNVVLKLGAAPLAILEEVVNDYIKKVQSLA
jgi:uncharacterized protein (DUF885 family)